MLMIGGLLLGTALLLWLVAANVGRRKQELLDDEKFESFHIETPQSVEEKKRQAEEHEEDMRLLKADMAAIENFSKLIRFVGILFFAGGLAALIAGLF